MGEYTYSYDMQLKLRILMDLLSQRSYNWITHLPNCTIVQLQIYSCRLHNCHTYNVHIYIYVNIYELHRRAWFYIHHFKARVLVHSTRYIHGIIIQIYNSYLCIVYMYYICAIAYAQRLTQCCCTIVNTYYNHMKFTSIER